MSRNDRSMIRAALVFTVMALVGCATGNQKVIWQRTGTLDYQATFEVDVQATTQMPAHELVFMKRSLENRLARVFAGREGTSHYRVQVVITRYDEGDSFARFMLAGLGQMHLHGTVEVTVGDPSRIVRVGRFEKSYSMGGVVGANATMHDDLVAKVGTAVAEAIKR